MQAFLKDTVAIHRATPSTGAEGDVTETFAPVASSVRADVQPLSGRLRVLEQGKSSPSTHRGFFARGTDIRVGDRVVIGPTTLLVNFVADYRHHLECDLAKVTL